MDSPPQKSITQIGTPVSRLKAEDSPVFKYICSLSPIKSTKSIPIAQTVCSFACPSSPLFATPHPRFYEGSRFRSLIDSSDPSKDGVASNEDCNTPRVIIDAGDNGCSEDGGMDLQKMFDNPKSDTPDWETLISATPELIYDPPSLSSLSKRTTSTLKPVSHTDETESFDALSNLHRGVRRRCLDFEIPGNNPRTLHEFSPSCGVPSSIGLLLNSIARSSKNNNVANEYSVSGLQNSTTPVLYSQQDTVTENATQKDAGQAVEDFPKSSAIEESISPKKKRRKFEDSGGECKRCNCKKSKCLKLYCECFAAGIYCVDPCACTDCFNKPIHGDVVLATRNQIESRNPLAFAPKVMIASDSIIEVGDESSKTPASARHIRGCKCRKSNCLKKYCACYQSGVGCSIYCRCEGCQNKFGRKDGSSFKGDEENNEPSGKSATAKTRQNVELFNPAGSPSTPMPLRQPLAQLPNSFNNRLLPPISHFDYGASGTSSSGKHNIRNPDMSLLSHSRIATISEGMPENLNQFPITNMTAVGSPNKQQ